MVSPRAWMVADGAEQRDRGGCASQLSLVLTAEPELADSRVFYCWRTLWPWLCARRWMWVSAEESTRCFPSLLAQCLWAARALGAPSWSVGFKEALPVLVPAGGD